MVMEMAQFEIIPGHEAAFEEDYGKALLLLQRSNGCAAGELRRSVERPTRYRALLTWESMAHHVEQFRGSADWRTLIDLITPHVAGPVDIEHYTEASTVRFG